MKEGKQTEIIVKYILRFTTIAIVTGCLIALLLLIDKQQAESANIKARKNEQIEEFMKLIQNKEEKKEDKELPLGTIGVMMIEKLGVEAPIGEGFDLETLKTQIGSYSNTEDFGQLGTNVGFTAHSATFVCDTCYFDQISELTLGDEVKVLWHDGEEYTFEVIESHLFQEPTSDYVIQTKEDEARITLVTCSQGNPDYRDFVILKKVSDSEKE